MEQNQRTQIGFLLLMLLFGVMYFLNYKDAKQQVEDKKKTEVKAKENKVADKQSPAVASASTTTSAIDSNTNTAENGLFQGLNETVYLQNDKLKVGVRSRGASIAQADVLNYSTWNNKPVSLMKSRENTFGFDFLYKNKKVNTQDIYFETISKSATNLVMQAKFSPTQYIQVDYTLNGHNLDYNVQFVGLNNDAKTTKTNTIALRWVNNTQQFEKSFSAESNLTTIYTKTATKDADYCKCTSNDEKLYSEKIQWVSHSQQFFQSTLISKQGFNEVKNITQQAVAGDRFMKKLTTIGYLPYNEQSNNNYQFTWNISANDYKLLKSQNIGLERIIPLGLGPIRWVNQFFIMPIFDIMSKFIPSIGLIIILLTLFIKLVLWPLTYKTFLSSAKMKALTPELNAIREKYPDDQMKQQQETMKVYNEAGVNPMGGCLPQLLQMPIWLAMYRFFPSNLHLRQQSFLWANDLSTFDDFIKFANPLPFIGNHISLFCVLMTISSLVFAWYNSKTMPPSNNEQMKQMQVMQYIFPFMLFFVLNGFSAGLTCYIFFSNVISILQTIITNNVMINHDKIAAEIDANRKKPKKQGGFSAKLQQVMQEAQRQQELKNKK